MHDAALQPVRCADAAAHAAQTGERWTLWVKGPRGDYGKFNGVDSEQDVHDFKARWAEQEELNVRPSHTSLHLVKCGPGVPTASEEAAALPLEPRLTLREAGVADGSSLLAVITAGARSERCA